MGNKIKKKNEIPRQVIEPQGPRQKITLHV